MKAASAGENDLFKVIVPRANRREDLEPIVRWKAAQATEDIT